jgi:signal peptidase II
VSFEFPVTLAKRLAIFFAVFAAQIGADQWSKAWASASLKGVPSTSYLGDTFRLVYATNTGAFLSLGAGLPDWARFMLLTVGVGVLLLVITVYALRQPTHSVLQVAGYGLISSGGFSNWFDRARFGGSVVDFMNMGIGSLRTGIFNVADVAILVGIGLLFLQSSNNKKRAPAAAAP